MYTHRHTCMRVHIRTHTTHAYMFMYIHVHPHCIHTYVHTCIHVYILLSVQVEMNWNICKYLPTEASCQDYFQVVIGGHIHELYKHSLEEKRRHTPGNTPVKRHMGNSQVSLHRHVDDTHTPARTCRHTDTVRTHAQPHERICVHVHTHTHTFELHSTLVSQDLNTTVSGVSFAKNRIEKDIAQQLFMYVQSAVYSVCIHVILCTQFILHSRNPHSSQVIHHMFEFISRAQYICTYDVVLYSPTCLV